MSCPIEDKDIPANTIEIIEEYPDIPQVLIERAILAAS
jgi:hypothetical protein